MMTYIKPSLIERRVVYNLNLHIAQETGLYQIFPKTVMKRGLAARLTYEKE